MSEPPQTPKPMLQPVQEVFDNAEILAKIVRNLDNGCARDLVNALQVSRPFFHASATTLCRRVAVPIYEFSRTKERGEHLIRYGWECESCDGTGTDDYTPTRDVTAHRSMEPGVPKDLVQSLQKTYRAVFPATPMMKELYKHVHVVTVDEHVLCDRLAISHPLPLARTVVIRGGQHGICRTSKPGLFCGFMPTHPFRLILDGLCGGLICRTCTSPQILSPFAETLVLHLQHDPFGRDCRSRNLPRDFHPKRLVLLFPQERVDKFKDFDYHYGDRWGMRERKDASALGPGDGGKALENVFYRIALMCLLVDNDCKIYVVAADQAALHLKGLERFETSLEECRPMAPEPQKSTRHYSQRFPLPAGAFWVLDSEGVEATRWMDRRGGIHHIDEILEYRDDVKTDFHLMMEGPLSQGYALPAGAHWILDNDQVEATRWLDKYGQVHHIEEIYECRYDYDDMQGSDRWRGQSGSDINPCYNQDGQVVSCICPRRIPPALLPVAESIIQKRVGAIEALVHKWLDFILDSRMPLEHWEDEKNSLDENGLRKWDNRHQFERRLHNLKAKRDQEKNQQWHNNHMCWAGCRDDYTPEVPESEDEDENGNVIRENRSNIWTDYGRPLEERWGDGSKRIVEPKRWRRGQKFAKTREEIEAIRKIKHGRIQFISTYEYHKMEGNNDEMDDPSKYL